MFSNIYNQLFSEGLILTLIVLIVPNCAQKASEMFSLDKLVEYNTLIDCFTSIKDDFSACNKEAHKRGAFVMKYVDETSSLGTLLKCCGTWQVRDCWVNAAKDKCNDGAKDQLHNLPAKFMPAINNVCQDYQPGSFYCFVPHLIGIAVLLGAVLLIGTAVTIAVVVYRRRMRLKRVEVESEHSNNNDDKSNEV